MLYTSSGGSARWWMHSTDRLAWLKHGHGETDSVEEFLDVENKMGNEIKKQENGKQGSIYRGWNKCIKSIISFKLSPPPAPTYQMGLQPQLIISVKLLHKQEILLKWYHSLPDFYRNISLWFSALLGWYHSPAVHPLKPKSSKKHKCC